MEQNKERGDEVCEVGRGGEGVKEGGQTPCPIQKRPGSWRLQTCVQWVIMIEDQEERESRRGITLQ